MRWAVICTKDEAADALNQVIHDVADPEGVCIGKIRCDGGDEFKRKLQALAESLGIPIDNIPPYIPRSKLIAELDFGPIIGSTRSLLLRALHFPEKL